jgi:cell division protein ZapA
VTESDGKRSGIGVNGEPSAGAAVGGQAGHTAVSVDIYDQVYHLRGTDAEYIEQLAAMVDDKMRAVAAHGSTVDSLRVAVLAALNIADELATLRGRYTALASSIGQTETSMRSRAGTLAGMLDEVLEDRRAG